MDINMVGQEGMSGDLESWLQLNIEGMRSEEGRALLAPYPPSELMEVTTGLTDPMHFAEHGVHFVKALSQASPEPLNSFDSILDFGCGVGRLARLFKGGKAKYTGVDVDARTVEWVSANLDYVDAKLSIPKSPLPLASGSFDAVISISVFTHMNEADQFFYLGELKRVTLPGATLLLTVHGSRALERALTEEFVFNLISCPREEVEDAKKTLSSGNGYKFILQPGHLTSDNYDYGITFINEEYIQDHWSKYFDVLKVVEGAIHDFQDVVVLRRRPS